uniref:Peptidase S54 rhomboid domain-containing protein n=1 Tax=Dunaliella tertiolecta TaxID=3047 RepID=A0A7S3QXY4_DUNTE|mmetsp:Transcript_24725/g.67420  ORF Transcript_24725/g.67420 Transcript_24725/m.67420 type:complete len:418 (-) Transcript_24725:802-2055(-)
MPPDFDGGGWTSTLAELQVEAEDVIKRLMEYTADGTEKLVQYTTDSSNKVLQLSQEGADRLRDYLDEISGSSFGQKAQDRLHRVRAEWQWGSHGLGTSLHVPIPCEVDHRFIVALAILLKVSSDQAEQHGSEALLRRPVTLALILIEAVTFMVPGGLPLRELCLSPFCVWEKAQWMRLVTPAVIHMDATHLMCNLATALPDCLELEASGGSIKFGLELVGLTGLSHTIYVAWALASKSAFRRNVEYYSVGAVGLSSVAFALQVVAGEQKRSKVVVMGVMVPSQYVWVFGLTLAHLCSPSTSFPGHLSGVLAGLMYNYGIKPVARLVKQVFQGSTALVRRPTATASQRGPRFWGGGTTGGRDFEPGSAAYPSQRSRWWKSWAINLGSQLGLVALATGVFLMSSGRALSKHPINSWQLR